MIQQCKAHWVPLYKLRPFTIPLMQKGAIFAYQAAVLFGHSLVNLHVSPAQIRSKHRKHRVIFVDL